jgi:hypothetical protein
MFPQQTDLSPIWQNLYSLDQEPKKFPKTAVFWHMTVYSLVPDYIAKNRETAVCMVAAARFPNLRKKFFVFMGPNKVYYYVQVSSAIDPILTKLNQIQTFPHCFSKMHFNTTFSHTYISTILRYIII